MFLPQSIYVSQFPHKKRSPSRDCNVPQELKYKIHPEVLHIPLHLCLYRAPQQKSFHLLNRKQIYQCLRHSKLIFINLQLYIIAACIFRQHSPAVINRIYDLDNRCSRISYFFTDLQFTVSFIFIILICKNALLVYIAVNNKFKMDLTSCVIINDLFIVLVVFDNLAYEQFHSNLFRSVCYGFCNFTLRTFGKTVIAFTDNNSQNIYVMYIVSKYICIHTFSILLYTKTETASYLLTLPYIAAALFQCTNLKYIWINPSFTI